MAIEYIDRTPPAPTGDPERDTQALYNYLVYLTEQLNHIIRQINRAGSEE